jgi:endonuclease/exonuclease/phosphatase family metal-dependent hydrolase
MIRFSFKALMVVTNIVCASALFMSYLALYISPEKFWPISFFGLSYPILLVVNVLFILFWAVLKKKWAILSAVLVFGGIGKWDDVYTFGWNKSHKEPNLTVMSYNVRLFDLYNWTKNKESRNKIFEVIDEAEPDILCMQEFYYNSNNEFNTLDTLTKFTKCKNYYIGHTAIVKDLYHWGIITMAKYPIVNSGIVPFDEKTDNISIFTDLKINQDTIRVYNVHLESIRLKNKEYTFIDSVANKGGKLDKEKTWNMISKMSRAFKVRAKQVDAIINHSEQCTYPVLICGDFNDTPGSYAYHQLSKDRLDAFSEAGLGFGVTYAGLIPFLRIDYMLYDNEFGQVTNLNVVKADYSDHFPIVGKFNRKNN